MIRLFQYKNGEIKITWNLQPIQRDYKYEWRRKQITLNTYQFLSSAILEVELKIHKGGRICYGMLAAQVDPHEEQDCVELSVAYTRENTIKYTGSCLVDDTYVYKGLPEEYVEKVINSISSTILQKETYPQCSICIENAANCEVGSSPMIFGIIADIMTNIICTSSEDEMRNTDIETFTTQYARNIGFTYWNI